MSVIERAQADLEYGTPKLKAEAKTFLREDAWIWATIAGGDRDVVKAALAKKYE